MARADIDELKIVIEADDKASSKVGDLVTKLEELSKLSIENDGTKRLGEDAEKTSERLNRAREALARLKDIASAGGFGSKMLSEVDAIQTKIGILENKADKLDLGKDKDVERFVNLSLQVSGLEKRLDRLNATALKEIAESAEKAKEATIETTKATKDLQETQDIASGKGAENTAEMEAEARAFHQEVDDIISSLGKMAHSARLSEVMDFAKSAKEADLVKMKLEGIYEQIVTLENKGGNPKTIASLYEQAQKLETKLKDLENTANTGGSSTSVLDKWSAKLPTVDGLLKKVTTSMKLFGKEIGKSSSKMLLFPFAQVAKGAKKLTGAIGKLFTKLKTVATYRALRGFIKMINEGFKEGTQNAYQWSKLMNNLPQGDLGRYAQTLDSLSSSALYLKNAFATIAIPILNRVEPAIKALVERVVDAINVFNQFMATLTGAKTWTKALYYPKEFAEGIDQATGSAKKLKDAITILGIDEINPLNAVSDPSRGGGGNDEALNYSEMFEEVSLEAENTFSEIFEPFRKAWENSGQAVLTAMENALSNIKELLVSVGESFWEVWTNGTGQEAIEHILGIFEGVFEIIGNISSSLEEAWETDGNGTRLVQAVADIFNDILAMWDDITSATAEWAKDLDLTDLIDAFADLAEGLEDVIEPLGRTVSWAWEHIILTLADILLERGLPAAVGLLSDSLGALLKLFTGGNGDENYKGPLEYIQGYLDAGYWPLEAILNGLSDYDRFELGYVGDNFWDAIGLEEFFESITPEKPLFEMLGDWWDDIYTDSWLEDFVDGFVDFMLLPIPDGLKKIKEWILDLFEWIGEVMDKFGGWIGEKLGAWLDDLFGLSDWFKDSPLVDFLGWSFGIGDKGKMTEDIHTFIDGLRQNLENEDFNISVNGNVETITDKTPQGRKSLGGFNGIISTPVNKIPASLAVLSGFTAGLTSQKDLIKSEKTLKGFSAILNWWNTNFTSAEGKKRQIGGFSAMLQKIVDKITGTKGIYNVQAYISKLVKSSNMQPLRFDLIAQGGGGKNTIMMKADGGVFSNGFWKKIPQYSSGTLNAGSLFVAGEAGAELVGNVGGRTEVLNQSQIAQAMASSMMQANAGQNALLQEQNNLLRQLLEKDTNVTAILSTSSLAEGIERKNRREGRTVIPVGV